MDCRSEDFPEGGDPPAKGEPIRRLARTDKRATTFVGLNHRRCRTPRLKGTMALSG